MSHIPEAEGKKNRVATKFECFAVLSMELRLMVWEEVAATPRCVDVWPASMEDDDGYVQYMNTDHSLEFGEPLKCRSHNPVPPVLQVCREARKIGLKYYTLSFGTHIKYEEGDSKMEIKVLPQIYANFDCDIICPIISTPRTHLCEWFQQRLSMNSIDMITPIPIKRIALPTTNTWNDGFWEDLDMMDWLGSGEIILYSGRPAPFKTMAKPFDPATAKPFHMDLISLIEAKERRMIGSYEHEMVSQTLEFAE